MVSFGQCCAQYIEAHRAGWRNPKHAAQWTATLATYCAPIYKLPVAEIDTGLVLRCLQPEWATKTETLSRVRQRLEAVLSWASVRNFRQGDNPARWRGHLDKLLPAPAKVKKVEHRAALPYADMPGFMAALRERRGVAARALELQILTAARPGEACGAMWAEIDLDAALWTIPATRMKAGKEHRIPLSAPAVAMLRELRAEAAEGAAYVFPTQSKRRATAVTTAAALKIARSIRSDTDAHGMRSTFRDWAAERTAYPREIVEAALSYGGLVFHDVINVKHARKAVEQGVKHTGNLGAVDPSGKTVTINVDAIQERLQATARLVTMGEMASSLAHELNQPLAAIVAYTQACLTLLRQANTDPRVLTGTLDEIVNQGLRAGEIIRHLRELVHKHPAAQAALDLNSLIHSVVHYAQLELRQAHITLKLELAESLPATLADDLQIQLVVLYLIRNAIEAISEKEGGLCELTIRTAPLDATKVLVTVRDTGQGFNSDMEDRLFRPFFTTKPGNMGLGLSVSRSIIESQGGQLWATANPDVGASFHFTLPIHTSP